MTKAFLIDVALCNGCYNCQVVCKDEHCGNDWGNYAAPQPITGQFWMRMRERVRGQVPWVRVAYTPVMCAHCRNAPCVKTCEFDAFVCRDDGLLLIDPEACNGCGDCAQACPLGAIFVNGESGIAQKCTGCAHLLDSEDWNGLPRCADACPTGALRFGEEEDFTESLSDAVALDEVEDLGARAYYLHVPKRFVAGTVVDLEGDEVIIGAEVQLLCNGEMIDKVVTDDFGDFLFDDINPAQYVVSICAKGFSPYTVAANLEEADLSVGDLFLQKNCV